MKKLIICMLVIVLLCSPFALADKGDASNNSQKGKPDSTPQSDDFDDDDSDETDDEDEVDDDNSDEVDDDDEDADEEDDDSDEADDNKGKAKGKTEKDKGQKIFANMTKEEKKQIIEEIKNKTEENKQMLKLELQNFSNKDKQKIFKNQNRVRETVMTLLAIGDATNMTGIGKSVSAIAMSFNNSVKKTIQAEEAIQNRGGIMRFLFGGDEKAAAAIQSELNKNQVMLQKLETVKEGYGPEFQQLIDEQTQLMQQEQERLMQLAEEEKGDKGLFGWLFK